MDKVKEMIERIKVLAELYVKEDKRVFIKDIKDDYYFADILFVGETRIYVQCFAPKDKEGKKYDLPYATIIKMEEYQEP